MSIAVGPSSGFFGWRVVWAAGGQALSVHVTYGFLNRTATDVYSIGVAAGIAHNIRRATTTGKTAPLQHRTGRCFFSVSARAMSYQLRTVMSVIYVVAVFVGADAPTVVPDPPFDVDAADNGVQLFCLKRLDKVAVILDGHCASP
jgi:hypothetical protein